MKKSITRFAPLSVCFLFFGCAATQKNLTLESNDEVCKSYGIYAKSPFFSSLASTYRDEINARKLIPDSEWELARANKITIGMSTCALYASWGKPDKENRSVSSGSVHTQHIFNRGYKYIKPTYVYTRNGTVTSWQD